MKGAWFIIWMFWSVSLFAQEEDHAEILAVNEEDMEAREAELLSGATVHYNINTATRDQLRSLDILSEEQLDNLEKHIQLFGKLLNKYELQAVEGFTVEVIRKLLPFISVEEVNANGFGKILNGGRSMMLFRITPGWFTRKDSSFRGSMGRVMARFQYNNYHFRSGVLIEKDPGEQLMYDHISFHLEYSLKNRLARKIILGDFTASFGQGLIQWQGYGFGRGGDVQTVQKPAASIASFHGSNEFNFHRGIAVELQKKRWSALLFASYKKLDGNLDRDTLTSISTGGLHRTTLEMENKKITSLISSGASISYAIKRGKVSLNAVGYLFDHPYFKRSLPYNHYAINNSRWSNISLDHQYTFRNIHLFGETAIDHRFAFSHVYGSIVSLHKQADLSIVYRKISPSFQSLFARSFTENTAVNNEEGIYVNYSYKWRRMLFTVVADHYTHSWVKYTVDAPSSGSLYSFQLKWQLSKNIELLNRFRTEESQVNEDLETTKKITTVTKYSFRSHLNYIIDKKQQLRCRIESLVLNKNSNNANGFISFIEYHRSVEWLYGTAVARIQYFEADDFDSRIYAFEREVTYGMSIPFFTGKGFRYFFVLQSKPAPIFARKLLKDRSMILSIKWSQSFPLNADSSNMKTEFKFQCILYNTHK